jgi:hypothetical protein
MDNSSIHLKTYYGFLRFHKYPLVKDKVSVFDLVFDGLKMSGNLSPDYPKPKNPKELKSLVESFLPLFEKEFAPSIKALKQTQTVLNF